MKVVTAAEMRRIDAFTIETLGIPGQVLMACAGRAVADLILREEGGPCSAAVACGCGNNGGDGFVIAWHLHNAGWDVAVFLAGDEDKLTADSRVYRDVCRNAAIPVTILNDETAAQRVELGGYDLIVDAILGTGFAGSPRGAAKELIARINASGARVCAVDVPSGLPSDGEAPGGEAVLADYTVTIGLPKLSLVTFPGKGYAGTLFTVDIGFPRSLTESAELTAELVDGERAAAMLPGPRGTESYKGSVGHLLFVGGFDGMEGAIMMSAMAAFETGIGLGTLLTTAAARNIIAGKIPELMTSALPTIESSSQEISGSIADGVACEDEKREVFRQEIREDVRRFFDGGRGFDAALVGPGMGRTQLASAVFEAFMDECVGLGIRRVVIDGDGLYHLAAYLGEKRLPEGLEAVITPHFLEASRLTGAPVAQIQNNRPKAVRGLASATGAVALLKGPATLVSDGERLFINTTGNPALATAGAGDVLSGIIAALLLGERTPLEAAALGAYIHGRAADLHVLTGGTEAMKSTDLLAFIRDALAERPGE